MEIIEKIVEEGDARRAGEALRKLATLTQHEQRLVREAAVLGFVSGTWAAGGIDRAQFPRDQQIVIEVLNVANDMNDLYPTLADL